MCCRCGEETNGIYVRANPDFCRDLSKHEDSLWTHVVCDACWYFWNPTEPARVKE